MAAVKQHTWSEIHFRKGGTTPGTGEYLHVLATFAKFSQITPYLSHTLPSYLRIEHEDGASYLACRETIWYSSISRGTTDRRVGDGGSTPGI
jgi:hypothetical protein